MLPWSGTSAGGGYSTVGHLLLFANALQNGKLLDPTLLDQATKDQTRKSYGLGFYVLKGGAYGHGGGSPDMNGELHILPPSGYVLIALANHKPVLWPLTWPAISNRSCPTKHLKRGGRAALVTEVQASVQPLPWYQATMEAAHSYGRINYSRIISDQEVIRLCPISPLIGANKDLLILIRSSMSALANKRQPSTPSAFTPFISQ